MDEITLDDIGFVKNETENPSNNTNVNCNIYDVSPNTRNVEKRQEMTIQERNLSSPPLCEMSLQQSQQQRREVNLERIKVHNVNR